LDKNEKTFLMKENSYAILNRKNAIILFINGSEQLKNYLNRELGKVGLNRGQRSMNKNNTLGCKLPLIRTVSLSNLH